MKQMILVEQISSGRFDDYSSVSPRFTVTSLLECEPIGGGRCWNRVAE
jgi:hypothetical protein